MALHHTSVGAEREPQVDESHGFPRIISTSAAFAQHGSVATANSVWPSDHATETNSQTNAPPFASPLRSLSARVRVRGRVGLIEPSEHRNRRASARL